MRWANHLCGIPATHARPDHGSQRGTKSNRRIARERRYFPLAQLSSKQRRIQLLVEFQLRFRLGFHVHHRLLNSSRESRLSNPDFHEKLRPWLPGQTSKRLATGRLLLGNRTILSSLRTCSCRQTQYGSHEPDEGRHLQEPDRPLATGRSLRFGQTRKDCQSTDSQSSGRSWTISSAWQMLRFWPPRQRYHHAKHDQHGYERRGIQAHAENGPQIRIQRMVKYPRKCFWSVRYR